MQITISKLTRQERAEFFRKNKWLIQRLWGLRICFPDLDGDDDNDDDDQVILQKHVDQHHSTDDKSIEDLQEELEELEEEIEEALEEIEEGIEEMSEDGIDTEEAELLEEIGDAIDDLQEVLEEENADAETDSDCADDLTIINGLGPKTAEGLIEAGITSFRQVAALTDAQVEALDDGGIRNFAKTYARKNFRQQAKDLL